MLTQKINALLALIEAPPLPDSFTTLDSGSVQEKLAAPLRALAIHQLQFSYNERAMLVREKAQVNGFADIRIAGVVYAKVTFQQFLDGMKCDGEWATDDLAAILGEALGVSIHLLNGRPPYYLYDAGKDAPVINLTNEDNVHWTFSGKATLGDGNCLFNAFALGLQDLVRKEEDVRYCPEPSYPDAPQQNNKNNVPVKEAPISVKPVRNSHFRVLAIGIMVIAAALGITFLSGGLSLLPMAIFGGALLLGYMLFAHYYSNASGNAEPVSSQQKMNAGLDGEPSVEPKNERKRAYGGASMSALCDSHLSISQNRHGMWGNSKKSQEKLPQHEVEDALHQSYSL